MSRMTRAGVCIVSMDPLCKEPWIRSFYKDAVAWCQVEVVRIACQPEC